MIDVIGDLYQYLSAQSSVTNELDIYGGTPAIFAGKVPPDHMIAAPVAVLDYPVVQKRQQTSSTIGRDISTTIRVFAQVQTSAGFDTLPLQQASEAIATALVTARILISGGILHGANVEGPINAPIEDTTLTGRLITVRWRLTENQT